MLSFFLDKYTGMGWLGDMGSSCLTFKKLPHSFPLWLNPLAVYGSSSWSASLLHLVLSVFFILAVLIGSYCGFNFHLPNGWLLGRLFLCLFAICVSPLRKYLFKYFAHRKSGLFSYCLLRSPYIYPGYKFFISKWLINFPFLMWLPFILFEVSFEEQKFLILVQSPLSVFSFHLCLGV